MASFNLKIGSPVRGSFKGGLGGSDTGGHQSADWFIQYGNDLAVATGTKIVAAFSGYVRKFEQHVSSKDTQKVYGAQLFMRSNNNKLGVFYTHFTRCPGFNVNQRINRGDLLGYSLRDHLHIALVEIIGGRPGDMPPNSYVGIDLYKNFLELRDSENVMPVEFTQDRKQPRVGSIASEVDTSWLNGWWRVFDGKDYFYYFSGDTVQYTTTKPTSNNAPLKSDNTGYYSYSLGELVINWTQKTGTISENVETFSNASPGCIKMNGTSNLYGEPLEAKQGLD
jgi:hypothetical protein